MGERRVYKNVLSAFEIISRVPSLRERFIYGALVQLVRATGS